MNLQSILLDNLQRFNRDNGLLTNVWGEAGREAANQASALLGSGLQLSSSLDYAVKSLRSIPANIGCNPLLLGETGHRFHIGETILSDRHSDTVSLRCYKNVRVLNWMDYYIVLDNECVIENISSRYSVLASTGLLEDYSIDLSGKSDYELEDSFLWAGDTEFFNYCHFIYDYLPQLSLLRDVPGKITLLKPASSAGFHDIIDPLLEDGGRDWNALTLTHGQSACVKRLFATYPHTLHPMYRCSWWAIDYLNSLANQRPVSDVSSRALYIRRTRRAILNEQYLVERLTSYGLGIDVVDFDGLTVGDQACLMRSYSSVIGMHGAGFSNIVFGVQSIAKVLEIIPLGIGMTSFASLSYRLGFRHSILGVQPISTEHPNYPNCILRDSDIDSIYEFLSS